LNIAQTGVEPRGMRDIVNDCRTVATRQRGLHAVEVRTQQSLVDHGL
jgi:hypothetical protein